MAKWAYVGRIGSYEDAVLVVLKGINMRVDPGKVRWCNYPRLVLEGDDLLDKVRKDTKKLEKKFEDGLCPSSLWYVGIPKLKLNRRSIPHLNCEIDLFYVACDVTNKKYNPCWFGRIILKADSFDVPLCLISPIVDAFKNNEAETEQVHIVERTSGYSVYEFMGREWKIPDAFLGFAWALTEKGEGFEGLFDPVSCALMDTFTRELPSPEAPNLTSGDDYQAIVSCLKEKMGYPKAQAEEAAKYVMEKTPNESLENKIKQALSYLSG